MIVKRKIGAIHRVVSSFLKAGHEYGCLDRRDPAVPGGTSIDQPKSQFPANHPNTEPDSSMDPDASKMLQEMTGNSIDLETKDVFTNASRTLVQE